MFDHPYDYELELWRKADGGVLGRVPVKVDWVPFREALSLDLLRRGVDPTAGVLTPMSVEPIWNERVGSPTLIGIRASSVVADVAVSRIFSAGYFSAQAQQASSRFVSSGDLKEGELFEYCVLAFPAKPVAQSPPRFSITQQEIPLAIKPARLDDVMNSALLFGTENSHDIPVLFHWRVLEEASVLTRRAGSIETGGVLIGHVCRDGDRSEIFLEITALIPAKARGELTRLSFTPDTWSDAQTAVDRRNRGEIWLGWAHSHSFYHAPEENKNGSQKTSPRQTARPFLSEEDCRLHRVCFPRAYGIALLITDSPQSGMSWTTFGWRFGQLSERAFHVIDAPLPEEFTAKGDENESSRNRIA